MISSTCNIVLFLLDEAYYPENLCVHGIAYQSFARSLLPKILHLGFPHGQEEVGRPAQVYLFRK